jgi:pyridoxine 4-dehydrogenase
LPRFQGEAFYQNLKLVTEIETIAKRKDVTPGQVGIAWIREIGALPGMPVMIPIPGASSEKRVKENSKVVELTTQDMAEIDEILKTFTVSGTRYHAPQMAYVEG